MTSFKHIPEEPVAIIIALKRKNGQDDYRSFTLPKEATYDYEKFIIRITEKFKLREPFNKYYILEYEYSRHKQCRITVRKTLQLQN